MNLSEFPPAGRESVTETALIGHEDIRERLKSLTASNRLPPSLLFWGMPGIGKTSCAVWLAKMLNCVDNKPGEEPCGRCIACRRIVYPVYQDGVLKPISFTDVSVIEPEKKEITIEQVRAIQKDATLSPLEGRVKVYILRDAQTMNDFSANCFLKLLEEPPVKVLIILVASGLRNIPPTILSRVTKFRFHPLGDDEMRRYLSRFADIAPDGVDQLVKLSRGLPQRAGMFAEHPEMLELREAWAELIEEFPAMSDFRATDLASAINKDNVEFIIDELTSIFRDMLVSRENTGTGWLLNRDMEVFIESRKNIYSRWQIINVLETLKTAHRDVLVPVNPKILALRTLLKIREELKTPDKL